jgi:hypothetical protein
MLATNRVTQGNFTPTFSRNRQKHILAVTSLSQFRSKKVCDHFLTALMLQLYYRVIITTTIWSAANISDHLISDCFLSLFYSTMLTSLVPYDSLCTVLANLSPLDNYPTGLTPVIMYPEIRACPSLRSHPIHLSRP